RIRAYNHRRRYRSSDVQIGAYRRGRNAPPLDVPNVTVGPTGATLEAALSPGHADRRVSLRLAQQRSGSLVCRKEGLDGELRQRDVQRRARWRRARMNAKQREALLDTLKARFEQNMHRHPGLEWDKVRAKLEADPKKLRTLAEMEKTGGEPDVVGYDEKTGTYLFFACSPDSPKGRRSVCYDRAARQSRKEHAPKSSAVEMAAAMGAEMSDEEQYRQLQRLG